MTDLDSISRSGAGPAADTDYDDRLRDDEAREGALRARLKDNRHPLTNAEWCAIHDELRAIKAAREGRAYDAQKHAPAHADERSTPVGGAVGLTVMLAVRSGVAHFAHAPPTPKPTGAMSDQEVDAEIARARATLAAFKEFPPAGLKERLVTLDNERAYRRAPALRVPSFEGEKQQLYARLAELGDMAGCKEGDTADALRARIASLSAEKGLAHDEEEAKRWSIGLDGRQGTSEEIGRYEIGQRLEATNGSLLATVAAVRGASTEEVRAWRDVGDALEGVGIGLGAAAEARSRATLEPSIAPEDLRAGVRDDHSQPGQRTPAEPRKITSNTRAPEPAAGRDRAAVRAELLVANKAAGDAWEADVVQRQLPLTQDNIRTQVTIRSNGPSNRKVRLDAVGTDRTAPPTLRLTDAKASATAPLTKNQKAVYPELEVYGGTVVGDGKPPYVGGTKIPPTKVDILRKE